MTLPIATFEDSIHYQTHTNNIQPPPSQLSSPFPTPDKILDILACNFTAEKAAKQNKTKQQQRHSTSRQALVASKQKHIFFTLWIIGCQYLLVFHVNFLNYHTVLKTGRKRPPFWFVLSGLFASFPSRR